MFVHVFVTLRTKMPDEIRLDSGEHVACDAAAAIDDACTVKAIGMREANNLNEKLLKPARSFQSFSVAPSKVPAVLPQSSKSMSAAEADLSPGYWRGAAAALSKAAKAGAALRANLALSRAPSVAVAYEPEGPASGPSWVEASVDRRVYHSN